MTPLVGLSGVTSQLGSAAFLSSSVFFGGRMSFADQATAAAATIPSSISNVTLQAYSASAGASLGGAEYRVAVDDTEYNNTPSRLRFTSANSRKFVIAEDTITPAMAGALGNDTADDGPALAACLLYLKTFGGTLDLEARLYATTQALAIEDAVKPFLIYGRGKEQTRIRRNANTFGTVLTISGSDDWMAEDFTVDAGNAAFPTNANHGFVAFDCNRMIVNRVHVEDWKNSAILVYTSVVADPPTHEDATLFECSCDGLGVANNGLIMVNYLRPVMLNCRAENIDKSGSPGPGYCFQMKNGCQYGSIINPRATSGRFGIALGNNTESNDDVGKFNSVIGGSIFDCSVGIGFGATFNGIVTGTAVDMNLSGNYAFDFGGTSKGWGVTGVSAINVGPGVSQHAAFFRSGDTDNYIDFANASKPGGGALAAVQSGGLRNSVVFRIISDPTNVSDVATVVNNSGGTTNKFRYAYLTV